MTDSPLATIRQYAAVAEFTGIPESMLYVDPAGFFCALIGGRLDATLTMAGNVRLGTRTLVGPYGETTPIR